MGIFALVHQQHMLVAAQVRSPVVAQAPASDDVHGTHDRRKRRHSQGGCQGHRHPRARHCSALHLLVLSVHTALALCHEIPVIVVHGRAQAAGGAPLQVRACGGDGSVQPARGSVREGGLPDAAGSPLCEAARALHAGRGAAQDVLRGPVEGARDIPVPEHVQGRQEHVDEEVEAPGAAGHQAAGDDKVHAPVGGAQVVGPLLHAIHNVLGHLAADRAQGECE